MRRIIDPKNPNPEPSGTDIIIDPTDLLQNTMIVLQREVRNLMLNSAIGKLEPAHAKDLVQYVELLTGIEEKKLEKIANMSDEELEVLAKAEKKRKKSRTHEKKQNR